MKDRQKAVQLTANMLGFPVPPPSKDSDRSKDHTSGDMDADNHLSDAVQELARQHPRARAKGKA